MKPANILKSKEFFKIADFGFAKIYQEGSEEESIHQTLVGSPIFMSPEILNGTAYSTKSDVWSIGIILYQMLYGKSPYKASNLEQLIIKVNKKNVKFPNLNN